jgi:hypothetical protein
MWWVRNEVIQYNMKICVISDRHRGVKVVFQAAAFEMICTMWRRDIPILYATRRGKFI